MWPAQRQKESAEKTHRRKGVTIGARRALSGWATTSNLKAVTAATVQFRVPCAAWKRRMEADCRRAQSVGSAAKVVPISSTNREVKAKENSSSVAVRMRRKRRKVG